MPATVPPKSSTYVDFDEYVDFQIEKTRNGIKWTDIVTAGAVVGAFIVAYLMVFAILDHWVIPGGFSQTARVFMVSGLLAVTCGWLAWKVVLPYLRKVSGLYAAQTIEASEPGFKSTLLNLIDLRRAGREIPEDIRGALEKRAAQTLSKMDVDQAIDRRPLMRAGYILLGLVVFACLYSVFSPKKLSFARAFVPPANVAAATRTEILELRTDPPLTRTAERELDVVARSQVEVLVDLSGEVPEEVTLRYTTADHKFVDEPVAMRPVEEGLKRFRGVLNGENGRGLLQNTTFHVVAGDAVSDEYKILVNQPPAATVEEVHYVYPKYMEFENKTQAGGNIDGWEGTKVLISATVNQPVKLAIVQFFDDETAETKAEEMRMEISGENRLRAEWTLKFRTDGTYPRSYRIFCVTDEGQSDPEPTLYTQMIRPDRRPVVELLEPRGDLEVPANAIIPLLIEAHDPDFKLRYVTLRREKNGEVLPRSPEIFKGLQKEFRGTWDWDLKPMDLKAGDVITYWAEARDNKEPLGNLSEKLQLLELHIVDRIPEEDVEKQLDKDRAKIKLRQEEAEQNDNEQGNPEQPQQQEGEGEPGEEAQEGGNEPKPGEGQPQENPDAGEEENKGEASDKPGDGNTNRENADNPQPGEEGNQPGDKPAEQPDGAAEENERPLDAEGRDDSEALRRLLEKMREQQEEQEKNGEDNKQPQEGNKGRPGNQQPNENGNKPGAENPDGKSETKPPQENQPGNGNRQDDPKPGQNPDGGDKPKNGDKPKAGENPDGGNKPENGEKPGEGEKNPDEGAKPNAEEKPGEGTKPENGDEPGAGQKPGESPKAGENDGNQGGPDNGNPEDKPSADGNSNQENKPGDGEKKPTPDSTNANKTDKPVNGEEKPAEDSDDAEKRKADGNEKGPASAGDPDAESTKAKNELKRKEGEKPTTRPSEEKPEGDAQQKENDGSGVKNPNAAKPAQETKNGEKSKPGESPEKQPTEPKETDPNSPAAKQDEQPDTGNEELKGKGRPPGQASDMPDGGEEGSGKPSDQGKSGGNKPGAGDATKKPGMEETSDGSKPGQPGDEKGDGSKQTEGDGKPGDGKPGSDPGKPREADGGGKPGDAKPGEPQPSGNPGGASKPGAPITPDKGPQGGDGKTSGGANQGPAGQGTSDDGDLSEAEKANMEFNKKAANLVLKRLQEQAETGEFDQKLLDEFGWTKEDMQRYLERMQRNLNAPAAEESPKTEAEQRQIEEFLKGYNLRQGNSDRDRSTGGTNVRPRPVPAEFREAFDAYTRSLTRKAGQRNAPKK